MDRAKFNSVLDSLKPRGKTPLALSIEQAVKDLAKAKADDPVTLLLLTDGGEDTGLPRRDPRKSAELVSGMKGVRFHVVGFDINQPDWTEQLLGMADRGGGHYWPAARAADLERGLRINVLGLPEQYVVLDARGRQVVRAAFGQSASLPEGKYRLQTTYAGNAVEREFSIIGGSTTSVSFDASGVSAAASSGTTSTTPRAADRPERPAEPITEVVKRFCTKCGAQLTPGAKFCEKCGAKVDATR